MAITTCHRQGAGSFCYQSLKSVTKMQKKNWRATNMVANIKMIEVIDGKDTDLYIDRPVYAIHLTDVREVK
jgi:hypothetical protein